MSDELQSLAPDAALKLYLDQRRGEVSEHTLRSHRYRLEQFVDWCEDEGIVNMNDLRGRQIHEYRVHRREEDDLKPVTMQGQLSTIRVFLQFCAAVEAVHENLPEKVMLPTISGDEEASESLLGVERAQSILNYLDTYEYASRDHVVLLLLWRTGMRTGGVRSLDLDDYDPDAPGVQLRHRPESDTPLKNGSNGERWVAILPSMASVIDDYIDGPRTQATDSYRREPLLTTREGRPHVTTIRNTVYRWTRPCNRGEECPHDRDVATCEATLASEAGKCPSARSPHEIRSGAITEHLLDEVPPEVVSGRMDVSTDVLDKHYDRRSEREKMEQRRKYLQQKDE